MYFLLPLSFNKGCRSHSHPQSPKHPNLSTQPPTSICFRVSDVVFIAQETSPPFFGISTERPEPNREGAPEFNSDIIGVRSCGMIVVHAYTHLFVKSGNTAPQPPHQLVLTKNRLTSTFTLHWHIWNIMLFRHEMWLKEMVVVVSGRMYLKYRI